MPPFRYCPLCASPLVRRRPPDDSLERQVCPACGRVWYENAKPCVGALITQNGRVLLARRAGPPAAGAWDLPGGFLEAWEHPEAGLVREIQEETGLTVRPVRLLGIFPDRYGADGDYTLNLHYLAEVVAGVPTPASDVAALAWFGPDEIPADLAFANVRQALAAWREWVTRPPACSNSPEAGC